MYRRFLNNNDYCSIVADEALDQLIRGNEERLEQVEEASEASIIEYLTDNYEIEKELQKGKCLLPYNKHITYPAHSHFYYDGKIYEALRPINGVKTPSNKIYWEELPEYNKEKFEKAVPYSQALNWSPGDIVKFANTYFECKDYNGLDFNDIRVPGVNAWNEIETYDWKPNMPYRLWDVVSDNGSFYTLLSLDNLDTTARPFDSNNWGMIGDYLLDYKYELKDNEYVVFENKVYYPVMNPVADELKDSYNIHEHDPRNPNIKKHMLRLAVYELFKLISPNNVSSARITDYETSMMWLRDANRCKINPQIPRKLDESDKPVPKYAIATYQKSYDPNLNIWQI